MSNNKQHIPTGYKPSPLGIIPEDWEVKRLGEVCDIDKESLSNKTDPNYEFDYISLSDVDSDCFETTTSKQTFRTAPSRARRIVKQGDVIISTVRPNLQAFTLIKDKVNDLIVSTGFAVLTPKQIISEYLFQYVFSHNVSKQFYQLVVGSNYPAVNSSDVSHLKIAVPSINEQQRIVDVLELWDTAIAKQTALIEQLTLRKRGLMQQLLTGKKRLKGFSGEWKEVRLGEIGTAYGGLVNKNKEDFENGNALFITYMNVFSNGKIDIDNLGQVRILPSEKQEQVQYGDIFFTVSSETPDEVGMASVLLNEVQNTYLNSFCFGYRLNDFKSIIPVYASYLFRGDDFRKDMYKIAQGSTRFNISKTEVLSMRITIPSIEEQNAIASVLVEADKEIELANKKLERLQEEKRGLMQVLLSGKKRIKENRIYEI